MGHGYNFGHYPMLTKQKIDDCRLKIEGILFSMNFFSHQDHYHAVL